MTKHTYFLLCIMSAVIIISSAYIKTSYQENFVPKRIREMYRPLSRNVRINYENLYNNMNQKFTNLFKRVGIL